MIRIILSDIFNAFGEGCEAICHQVNCQGVMNSGLAKDISKVFPEVKEDYKALCMERGIKSLLGTYLDTPVEHGRIISIFGQAYYGKDGRRYTSYEALARAFGILNQTYAGKTLAFPYGFGCGLGGGDWSIVIKLMQDCFTNCDINIYKVET